MTHGINVHLIRWAICDFEFHMNWGGLFPHDLPNPLWGIKYLSINVFVLVFVYHKEHGYSKSHFTLIYACGSTMTHGIDVHMIGWTFLCFELCMTWVILFPHDLSNQLMNKMGVLERGWTSPLYKAGCKRVKWRGVIIHSVQIRLSEWWRARSDCGLCSEWLLYLECPGSMRSKLSNDMVYLSVTHKGILVDVPCWPVHHCKEGKAVSSQLPRSPQCPDVYLRCTNATSIPSSTWEIKLLPGPR